jgi:SAM-dependent methyltransferase
MTNADFLEVYWNHLSTVNEEAFVATYESFLRELVAERDLTHDLHPDARYVYAPFFTRCQRRYLAIKEKETYEKMMAVVDGATVSATENITKGFGRDAYERVSDLTDLTDMRTCHNVVMVGCGAFPATLFWLHDHYHKARYTGLDIDARCVDMAKTLAEAMGINDIHIKLANGSDYEYDGVDFVFVANQVVAKKAVLEQVSRSDSVGQVVVREPTRKGELLAEAVRYNLPREFVVINKGAENSVFLSYDLFLRRV